MTNFLILIVIGLLIYMICKGNKETGQKKTGPSYREILPQYLNKNCEIMVKKPLASIDAMYSLKGVLIDMDDEWIMLAREEKKKKTVKVLRIENISGIKEII